MEFTLAQKLRAAALTVFRNELGVTLRELGELTGYSHSTVAQALRGRYHQVRINVDAIHDAVETALNEVAAEQENNEAQNEDDA